MIVVSTGCPSGIGPEVSVAAAARMSSTARCLLVGDFTALCEAAELVGLPTRRLVRFTGQAAVPRSKKIFVLDPGPPLSRTQRSPGRPSSEGGRAQLAYLETAVTLVKRWRKSVLVTGPVNKAAIARSGLRRARRFRGHTEWLRALDGADQTIMCFYSPQLATSLVTTHLPLARVPKALSVESVSHACIALADLLRRLGNRRPSLAVVSLNPHSGESELLGSEEIRAIVPGIDKARRALGRRALLAGPIGAETAYRLGAAGGYDGVVAMYHDQATIPLKLVAFGDAVNVTMGLSFVRTSVDHGTAYDIAWKGQADPSGMLSAMRVARRLSRGPP